MLKLQKIEAGAYVTTDDRWLVVRRDSMSEFDTTSTVWVAGDYGAGNATRIFKLRYDEAEDFEAPTKRELVAKLEAHLSK